MSESGGAAGDPVTVRPTPPTNPTGAEWRRLLQAEGERGQSDWVRAARPSCALRAARSGVGWAAVLR